MREKQVFSTTVDIKCGAQVVVAHHRTLQMPARTALPPGAWPEGLPRLGLFPERKIHGMAFFFVHGYSTSGLHVFQFSPGKLPVALVFFHRKIDVFSGHIGHPSIQQGGNHLDHAFHMFGGPGLVVGLEDSEPPHILVKGIDIFTGDNIRILARLVRPLNDLVIHIRKITDIGHLESPAPEVTDQDVENDGRSGMPDVAKVIHRDPADIHGNLFLSKRLEKLFLPCRRII